MFAEDETPGLRRSELVGWYLKEIESEIDSEAELIEKKTIVEKVIERLVHHVSSGGIIYLLPGLRMSCLIFLEGTYRYRVQSICLFLSFRSNFLKWSLIFFIVLQKFFSEKNKENVVFIIYSF